MNSLVKVFSNFKEFYNEINGATLTGAIDVIVVEQPDGSFLCSPFHVRFGKLGVLRSREKIVDIEVNGEPVDIHMKLGESGEAFFVEECPEDDLEQLPANMATSPLPTSEFAKYVENKGFSNNTAPEDTIQMPMPRRNSIDLSKESEETGKIFENQISDFSHRRHTDNTLERRDLSTAKKEFTTQKLRQEWAVHEEQIFGAEGTTDEWQNSTMNKSIEEETKFKPIESKPLNEIQAKEDETTVAQDAADSKSKKKRRKKSMMKKKQTQRKSSSSSSVGSVPGENENDTDTTSVSNNTNSSTNEESPKPEPILDVPIEQPKEVEKPSPIPYRVRDLDIHFFSDTEIGSGKSPQASRPSTPIQSDSEIEISLRDKAEKGNLMTNSASWKWGELPTQGDDAIVTSEDAKQAQRNSMLSNMFSFMKQSKKMRKTSSEGVYLSELDTEGMDPEVAALYFPPINKADPAMNIIAATEDDRESGNGTSLPHSPSSVEEPKSLDSDYDDGKAGDNNYLDFVAMSMCGGLDQGGPTDEEFERNIVQYSEVCQNPSIFSSPLLVVRLNGKYYSWTAACPIVMTVIAYQKPLTNDAIEQLMSINKPAEIASLPASETKRGYSSWWYWRRSGGEKQESKDKDFEGKDGETIAVGTQTSRTTSPEGRNPADYVEANQQNLTGQSDLSELNKSQSIDDAKSAETFRKSLRLTTEQIESLNLKNGMNEISFSVTTAYQGTSRCKCYLFRWKHNDKVVISDIDGTITKSDVLGHILPMVGRDWAQIGVAQLFSKIEENGYKLLYLSARAIGQSKATREYLRSIRQGNVKLPDGPLLLNPTSLISALHREVIEKKPEQFKIACLSDIQALFQKNPFYAGYGNKINDVWAYRAVGIPIMRIFTINPKGELKHELTQTFQSTYTGQSVVVNEIFPPLPKYDSSSDDDSDDRSTTDEGITSDDELQYCNMTYIVDQLFPPINDIEESVEFSNFNYWREPVQELGIEFDLLNSTSTPTTVENQKV
ncbi:Phosphatidate phosphatase LPIN2 [Pseudolycoriella hygida]|uniref:phosphatidate phosphatase n=1 Tax=Pseudolycoriella hygida TaxID=35572 RepID=A0A9Q0N273_9DIPT|nr:Phosphatidate phosphatase LPIN2 [Pseudolycoriella hygida]